ncbi:MAG: hypothetical protein DLM65_10300 [Candidatus Aeolococcus gillhamiae]|uniref:Lipoprotein n=1 Tax=Candidatus Aeolococcus gillhamiae TaxID=3127015 RepID=A0A2W5Z341_9BACT|nr:MAG: hypothetical protein DLM65_10300 [Candidatus Dormibacter sp. RRmetagenome_bin12]
MRSIVLKLALPVFVVGLAACGSSNNTTTNTRTAAAATPSAAAGSTNGADAICATYNTQINAVRPTPAADPSTADAAGLPGIATWIDQVLIMAMQEQQALGAAPDAGSLNGPFANVITTFHQAGIAAKGTDAAAFQTAWASFIAAQKTFFTAATAGNFPNCAK